MTTANENDPIPQLPDPSGLIAPADLDAACLCALLDKAGFDRDPDDDSGAIYITGLAFPFWLTQGTAYEGVHLFSHWMLHDQADEIEALRFANALNSEKLMVQFSLLEPGRHGLTIAPILRSLHRFSGCFAEAVATGRALDLLRRAGPAAAARSVLH